VTAVLYGYFALSGDQEESAICSLGGFIAEADDWNDFDNAWEALLAGSSSFNIAECLHGTGAFHSWDIRRRHAIVAGFSEVLARSALVPVGTFAVREHFARLTSRERAILSAEGIESLLDLIFYNWTERIVCRAHEQSEKISLLFCQDSQAEQYRKLFKKHLGRYLLGPHLTGDLAFARLYDDKRLQPAKLLSEAVLLIESAKRFPQPADSSFPIPHVLQQMADQILQQGGIDAAELRRLTERLKGPDQTSIASKQDPRS
jgi:hypothetical protein